MGATVSSCDHLLPEFARTSSSSSPPHWLFDLPAIQRLITRFSKIQTEFGFAINYETFKNLFKSTIDKHQITETELNKVYALFSPNEQNHCDSLQIFAGFIIIAKGSFKNKIDALFNLFDMDMNGAITRDEMTILIRASLNGLCRLCGTKPPDMPTLLNYAKLAFISADRQQKKDNRIEAEELYNWALATPECLELLTRFNTVDNQEIKLKAKSFIQAEQSKLKPSKPAIPTIESITQSQNPSKPKSRETEEKSLFHNNNNNSNNNELKGLIDLTAEEKDKVLKKASEGRELRRVFDELDSGHIGAVSMTEFNSLLKKKQVTYAVNQLHNSLHSGNKSTTNNPNRPRSSLLTVAAASASISTSNSNSKNSSPSRSKVTSRSNSFISNSASNSSTSSTPSNSPSSLLITFPDILRTVFPDFKSPEIDYLCEIVTIRPIPDSLIRKIKFVFDELDVDFTGKVEFDKIINILKPSAKLAEFISLPANPQNPHMNSSTITLHQLYHYLFSSTHSSQLSHILCTVPPSKSLTSEQRKDLANLFRLYDQDNSGSIDLNELKASAQLLQDSSIGLEDTEIMKLFDQFDFNHDQKIDLHEFQKFYRNIWAQNQNDINFNTKMFKTKIK